MKQNKMMEALNTQINKEFYSAYLYLAIATYFESINLKGFANWMRLQFQEEMSHGMKIYDYILARGYEVKLLTIEATQSQWKSPLEIFEKTYHHEQLVTKMIHDLVALSIETKDYATQAFLQWFVNEQVEEESNASAILEKLKLIGDSNAILFLDAELGKRTINSD